MRGGHNEPWTLPGHPHPRGAPAAQWTLTTGRAPPPEPPAPLTYPQGSLSNTAPHPQLTNVSCQASRPSSACGPLLTHVSQSLLALRFLLKIPYVTQDLTWAHLLNLKYISNGGIWKEGSSKVLPETRQAASEGPTVQHLSPFHPRLVHRPHQASLTRHLKFRSLCLQSIASGKPWDTAPQEKRKPLSSTREARRQRAASRDPTRLDHLPPQQTWK